MKFITETDHNYTYKFCMKYCLLKNYKYGDVLPEINYPYHYHHHYYCYYCYNLYYVKFQRTK
jgi:hypothetical protein